MHETGTAIQAPRATTARIPSGRAARVESYRDWAVITLFNHSVLVMVATFHLPTAALVAAALLLGAGFALGAITVLHDAGHRRFSRSYLPNMLAVQVAAPIGLWAAHFTLKHRVHHRLPAAYPYDDFTRTSGLLRLHPQAPWRKLHRFQWFYAWPLYALLWPSEIMSQLRYLVTGRIGGLPEKSSATYRAATFFAEKTTALLVLLPYLIVAGYRLMLPLGIAAVSGGFLAACILLVGHVNVGLQYDRDPRVASDWPAYVAATTASFATGTSLVPWITGGLTHHLAHHLRPAASRKDLRHLHIALVDGIRTTSTTPPVEFATLRAALRGHIHALKQLGSCSASAGCAEFRSRREISR